MQPRSNVLEKSVARRLKWVQGNVLVHSAIFVICVISNVLPRLEPLPFLDSQFDFVRMVRMGLHIPEDEVSIPPRIAGLLPMLTVLMCSGHQSWR